MVNDADVCRINTVRSPVEISSDRNQPAICAVQL
jgi:hypothetical protein